MKMLLKQTADGYKGEFREFEPFPRAKHPEGYKRISPELKRRILEEGETYLGYKYPSIFATDFMNFKRTGNRVTYEALYFARRHALCALVTAECVEQDGRFMDDIVNGIFVLCEESGWQLPPHNSYQRDKPQLLLPDSARPVLDLFACETGALLACVSYLLGRELEEISPLITARIQEELNRRIVTPYLGEHFWWMGQGDEPMCNWTAWCTQNVLLTVFLGTFGPDARLQVFRKAAQSLDFFLKDYGEDGCCDEGAQYYRHAGLCLCNAMEILDTVSDGAFSPLFETEKIRNIAAYIMNVHVADKYYFNFSDCSPIAGRAGVQEYLFGKYTRQPQLMAFAAQDFRACGGELYSDEVNRINLYHRFQNIVHWEEVYSYGHNTREDNGRDGTGRQGMSPQDMSRQDMSWQGIPPQDMSRQGIPPQDMPWHDIPPQDMSLRRDIFYPSVGLFLTRSGTLDLAVKAGDNGDNHNHNDTGSFTLYKNGQPLFVDIGVESYTEKTFSSRRYEIWTMQSGYHNLPTLMGTDQRDGEAYCATEIDTCFGDNASISMELLTAYPIPRTKDAGGAPLTYRRRVTLAKKEGKVVVKDTTNLPDVILNFITYEKPVLDQGRLQIGSLASAVFTGAAPLTRPENDPASCSVAQSDTKPGAQSSAKPEAQSGPEPGARFAAQPGAQPPDSSPAVEVLPITDDRLKKAWDHDLYRVRLRMTGSEFTMEIR